MTTSSCGGRVSVFLEGRKGGGVLADEEMGDGAGEEEESTKRDEGVEKEKETKAGVGGKGGGGRWLFVSHDPVSLVTERSLAELLGMSRNNKLEEDMSGKRVGELRFIHFKFEPMVTNFPLPRQFPI